MARVSDDSRNDSTRNESRGAFDDTADSDRILSPAKLSGLSFVIVTTHCTPNLLMPLPAHSHLPIHDASTATFVS